MKSELLYLEHIITRCKRIIDITASMNYETFEENSDAQDVMIRSFEIIGEATTHFTEEFKNAHPELLWKEMHVFRNVLIHQYFRLDLREIWGVASLDIPVLYNQVLQLKKSLEHESVA